MMRRGWYHPLRIVKDIEVEYLSVFIFFNQALREAKEAEEVGSPAGDDDAFSTTSKKSKKSREPTLSPPPKRSR